MADFTIKASGGSYDTLQGWEDAEAATLSAPMTVECYDFEDSAGGGLTVSSGTWSTDSTNFIDIYVADGEGHDGRSRDVSGSGFEPVFVIVTSRSAVSPTRTLPKPTL